MEIKPANWKILDALSEAYPGGLSAKELRKFTKQSISHVYRNLSNLERENYLIKIPGERDQGGKPSQLHIIEESSGILQSLFNYQLSPTSIKLSEDFKNAWDTLVSKKDETDILHQMMLFTGRIVRRAIESNNEEVKKIAPNIGEDYCCKNCELNHEARDFIRAVLIHLIDRLEVQREFVIFLKDHQMLKDRAFEKIIKLSEQTELEDKRTVVANQLTKSGEPTEEVDFASQLARVSIRLRILSIQKDSLEEQIPFTATHKNGRLFEGTIDQTLVRDELTSNVVVECETDTDTFIMDYYHRLRISLNGSIKVKGDDSSFPTLHQLKTKIEDIDLTKREYILNGVVVLSEPEAFRTEDGKEYTRILLGDDTGYMTLQEEDANYLDKLHKNDNLNVINAVPYSNLLLLSPYGSIEKIQTVEPDIADWLLERGQVTPPNIIAYIGQEQSRGAIKVRLDKLYITNDYMLLFATIENTNKNTDITLQTSRLKAIQRKRQFESRYKTDNRYRKIKDIIPPEVEETGVLAFERPDSTEEDIKFIVPLYQHNPYVDNTFIFNVKLSR